MTLEEKSRGHVAFIGNCEYFTAPNGDLYVAMKDFPLAVDGYRMGARFECVAHKVDEHVSFLKEAARTRQERGRAAWMCDAAKVVGVGTIIATPKGR